MLPVQDYFIFDESDLVRIGVVCPDCNTESVFDLSKDQGANVARGCPGCGKTSFVEKFTTKYSRDYNWVTWYKSALDAKKSVGVRLYFKKPTDAPKP